jgi:hypothetical protein
MFEDPEVIPLPMFVMTITDFELVHDPLFVEGDHITWSLVFLEVFDPLPGEEH